MLLLGGSGCCRRASPPGCDFGGNIWPPTCWLALCAPEQLRPQPPAQVAPYVCCAANTARAQAWLPLHSQARHAGRWQHACCVSSMPRPMIQPRERRRQTIPRLARAVLPVSACAAAPAAARYAAALLLYLECPPSHSARPQTACPGLRPHHPCSRPPARPPP